MVVDTGSVGRAAVSGSVPDFVHSFTAQVPALCQELDGRHLELSLDRHDIALTVWLKSS